MLKFKRYHDPGHSWLAVKRELLEKVGTPVSSFSYERGGTVYLEEDSDMFRFLRTLTERGIEFQVIDKHTNKQSRIRSYSPYRYRLEEFIRDHFVLVHVGD